MRGHGEGMVTGTSSQKVSRGRGFDNFEGDEMTGTLSHGCRGDGGLTTLKETKRQVPCPKILRLHYLLFLLFLIICLI